MKNMGKADKIIRILVAAIIAFLFVTGTVSGTTGILLLVLGGIFLATTLIGTCPLYLPFGIRTNGSKSSK